MSSTNASPSESHDSASAEHAPQVVVRAGKTYICSACGTLVEVPADVVGQLVRVAAASPDSGPEDKLPQPETPRQESVTSPTAPPATTSPKQCSKRPRCRQPSQLIAPKFDLIDGLRVPTAPQLKDALAWVSFRLKVLDRQDSELQHLKKRLKRRRAAEANTENRVLPPEDVAQADAGLAVDGEDSPQQRGPPL